MTAYRDATADDAPAIDGLFKSVFCGTFGHLYRAEDLDAFPRIFPALEAWRTQLDRSSLTPSGVLPSRMASPIGYAKLGPMKLPSRRGRPSISALRNCTSTLGASRSGALHTP